MTDDINNAFTEAAIDTFDALYKPGGLTTAENVNELQTSYVYLQDVANVPAQVLFDNISKGANDLIQASDHRMLISGATPRELTCDTCGRLISHHGGKTAGIDPYATFLTAVQDVEAIIALTNAVAGLGR